MISRHHVGWDDGSALQEVGRSKKLTDDHRDLQDRETQHKVVKLCMRMFRQTLILCKALFHVVIMMVSKDIYTYTIIVQYVKGDKGY